MAKGLQVGAGRAIITPPVGTMLYGYAPGRPAESVHDDLRVTCIALADDASQMMLISADICTYSQERTDRLRGLVSAQTGIKAENIIFSATHTHSGPATNAGAGWGITNERYNLDQLEPGVLSAARTACAHLQPALMGVGTTASQVSINRRQINRDGTISLGQNPWGPYDPAMTVISFKTKTGQPIANLVHYCCHGTAAGKSPEITRDWSGPMVDRLEEQSGTLSVFFNGAEGDIGPRLANGKTTGDLKQALELGAKAGFDAVRAWRSIKEYRDVKIAVITRDIQLPYKPLPDLETTRRVLEDLGDPEQLTGIHMRTYDRWKKVLSVHEKNEEPQPARNLQQSILAVGPVVFVPFPFEVFVEITLRIRQLSPFPYTLCLSNTNGSYGYFPTCDQFARGGYEIAVSRLAGAYEQTEQADDHAVEQNVQMLDELGAMMFT